LTSAATKQQSSFGAGDALALTLVTIWGLNYPITKRILDEFLPLSFDSLRFVGATLFLLVVLRLTHETWSVQRSDLPRFVMLGLIGNTLYQIGFVYGLKWSTASNVSLLIATSPTMVVILGTILGMERSTRRTWLGVAMTLLGLVLVIGGKESGLHLGWTTVRGDLLALGAALTWAIYTLFATPLFERYTPLKVTTTNMVFGTIPLLLVSLPSLASQNWRLVGAASWGGLAYSTTLSIAVGYVIFYTCVKWLGRMRTAVYFNLTPVVSTILAFIVLGERLTVVQVIGAAVVLSGVFVTRRSTIKE
jgi:drug/metabolite transporter (DMT)-like permease